MKIEEQNPISPVCCLIMRMVLLRDGKEQLACPSCGRNTQGVIFEYARILDVPRGRWGGRIYGVNNEKITQAECEACGGVITKLPRRFQRIELKCPHCGKLSSDYRIKRIPWKKPDPKGAVEGIRIGKPWEYL